MRPGCHQSSSSSCRGAGRPQVGCSSLPWWQEIFFCNSKGSDPKSAVFPLISYSQQRPHSPPLIPAVWNGERVEEGNGERSSSLAEEFYQQFQCLSTLPKPRRGTCSQFTLNHKRSVKQLLLYWAIWIENLPPGQTHFK